MKDIQYHQRAIQILEAIEDMQFRKALAQESLEGFPGTFPELRRKYQHRIEIIDLSINRLKLMYESFTENH